jgi:hypothetical protein
LSGKYVIIDNEHPVLFHQEIEHNQLKKAGKITLAAMKSYT